MPASASPRETLVTTALALSSRETGVTVRCWASRACWAYLPAGTPAAPRTTLRSPLARSGSPLMPFGLPLATTICSRLLANTRGGPTRLATLSMLLVSAEANTSAGAPCWIWVASAWLPAKLKVTLVSGCAAVKSLPSLANAAVSDAAANTLISVRGPAPEASPPPQPAASTATASRTGTKRIRVRTMPTPSSPSALGRKLDHPVGRLDRGDRQHPGGQAQLVGGLT